MQWHESENVCLIRICAFCNVLILQWRLRSTQKERSHGIPVIPQTARHSYTMSQASMACPLSQTAKRSFLSSQEQGGCAWTLLCVGATEQSVPQKERIQLVHLVFLHSISNENHKEGMHHGMYRNGQQGTVMLGIHFHFFGTFHDSKEKGLSKAQNVTYAPSFGDAKELFASACW